MCLFGNAVYMMAIGIASHKRNLRLREVREALRQRTLELSHTLAQLQKSQADLLEAEKLASLGSLVAGVAHELNTPIGNALVTATTLDDESRSMAEQMAAGTMKRSGLQTFLSRSSEMSDLIVRSCQRAAKLIVSFKKVAVDQTSEQQRHFHLREVVEDHLVTVGPSLTNAKIEIINCVPDFITCNSYPGALGQVVSSVVQNAVFHAFGPDDAGSIVIEAHADTRQATLIVRDNGKGMSAEVVKHVFEPFFTTRLGQGESGLGLTICRNITTGVLGGNMRVVSVPDQGSSFLIEFPLQAPHRAVAQAAASG
jgi:signal transduction histidine kinase